MKATYIWINSLPESIRTKAVDNIKDGCYNVPRRSLSDALFNGLIDWKDTPEGVDYWEEIFDNAVNGDYD